MKLTEAQHRGLRMNPEHAASKGRIRALMQVPPRCENSRGRGQRRSDFDDDRRVHRMTSRKQARRRRGSMKKRDDPYSSAHQAEPEPMSQEELDAYMSPALRTYNYWYAAGEREFVYFIRQEELAGDHRPVKIGYAASPWKRRDELQTGSPFMLDIEHVILGTRDLERLFHQEFDARRTWGEWFGHGYEEAILAIADEISQRQVKMHKEGRTIDSIVMGPFIDIFYSKEREAA